MRVGVITVSDRCSQGLKKDETGEILKASVKKIPAEVAGYCIVPDKKARIQAALISFVDDLECDVVFTAGGTGLGPRDGTPEATRELIEKEVPGIAEAVRREGMKKTPLAILSRGIAGSRRRSLIVNLPGSPEAVREGMNALKPILGHAVSLLKGELSDCRKQRKHE